jgi:hypothetical protein
MAPNYTGTFGYAGEHLTRNPTPRGVRCHEPRRGDKKLHTLTLTVPEHWIPALLMGDFTSFDRDDLRSYAAWATELQELGTLRGASIAGDTEDGRFFAWDHEGTEHGVAGCMCYDVQLVLE